MDKFENDDDDAFKIELTGKIKLLANVGNESSRVFFCGDDVNRVDGVVVE